MGKRQTGEIILSEKIISMIHRLPGLPEFMLGRDVAELYMVKTKRLMEQVSRNQDLFPADFYFQLTENEMEIMMSQNEISGNQLGRGADLYGFTRNGCNMVATVLKSAVARQRSIQIMRAFTGIEETLMKEPDKIPAFERLFGANEQPGVSLDDDLNAWSGPLNKIMHHEGHTIHVLDFPPYGEICVVAEVGRALGKSRSLLREKSRVYPEVRRSIHVLRGAEYSRFHKAFKHTGAPMGGNSISICKLEMLPNLLLYGNAGKEELALWKTVNSYLMGTRPAVAMVPVYRDSVDMGRLARV